MRHLPSARRKNHHPPWEENEEVNVENAEKIFPQNEKERKKSANALDMGSKASELHKTHLIR